MEFLPKSALGCKSDGADGADGAWLTQVRVYLLLTLRRLISIIFRPCLSTLSLPDSCFVIRKESFLTAINDNIHFF